MKQIICRADDHEHATLKREAKQSRRTIGQHVMALAMQARAASVIEPLQPHTAVANMLRGRNKVKAHKKA